MKNNLKGDNKITPDYKGWVLHVRELEEKGISTDVKRLMQLAEKYNCPKPKFINGKVYFSKEEHCFLWWNSQSSEEKIYKVIEWLEGRGRDVTSRNPDNLTQQEVLDIFNKFGPKEKVF